MSIELFISILGSVIATFLVGSVVYKMVIKKKNKGIIQKKGRNQISIQNSKNNSINIGGDLSNDEKRNNPERRG